MNKKGFKEKYQTIERVGSGKMGVIYKVRRKKPPKNPDEPEIFASKHISLHRINLEEANRELTILEQLKLQYIVRYIENFVEDDELIIIMEYCESKDLTYHIEKMKQSKKHFSENIISTWIFQLILAIDYIHSRNVIHRDLKPQNIFLDGKMNLKIGDFGVSKLLDGSQNCVTMAGTPFYISPELSRNEKYSKKTDIWSLGCVIYEICALEKPFKTSKGFMDLIRLIQNSEPPALPSMYSKDINILIKKMITKDASKRPSASDLIRDRIVVNLMMNYSSQINLLDEYKNNLNQPVILTESFIQKQTDIVNNHLCNFEQEIKRKMMDLKLKKKLSNKEIEKQYENIKYKMKDIENAIKHAFEELKGKNFQKSGEIQDMEGSSRNSKFLEESDETIQSMELGAESKLKSKIQKSEVKKSSQLKGMQDSSMELVESIMLKSKPANIPNNSDISEKTLKSEYMNTLKQKPESLAQNTLNHLEAISQCIAQKPELLMNETFLNCTLSISQDKDSFKYGNKKIEDSLSLNFTKKTEQSQERPIPQEIDEDSLQQYEPDFQEIEEEKVQKEPWQEIDFRERERKAVKQLFTSTLKSIIMKQKEHPPPNKYNLTLSVIKQHSSDGGSILSKNDDGE